MNDHEKYGSAAFSLLALLNLNHYVPVSISYSDNIIWSLALYR